MVLLLFLSLFSEHCNAFFFSCFDSLSVKAISCPATDMKFTLVYVLLLYSKRGLALLETSGYKTRCTSASRAVHCQRSWPVATAGASSNEASSFSPGYLGSLLLDGYAPRDCNSSSHNLYDGGNLATALLTTMICQATAH